MSLSLSPNQLDVQIALQGFLTTILAPTVEVIEGQDNRVPEPASSDFVVMTTIRRERVETNIDLYADCAFVGSISGTTLTISSLTFGIVTVGNSLFGVGVSNGTTISAQSSGTPGGVGVYIVSTSQSVSSGTLACGIESILQPTKITVQLDVHGPNSADNAQLISTLFRDDYGVTLFAQSGYDARPLYADEPKQIPFQNENQQWETRWIVEAVLQANQVVDIPMQFAGQVNVLPISVTVSYPL